MQLYLNGQTQSGWGLSGDYSRSSNLQRLQLWNDAGNTVDFDDVTVAAPAGAGPSAPGAPTSVSGTAGNGSVAVGLDGAGLGRWERDHRLPGDALRRRDGPDAGADRLDGDQLHRQRPDQRDGIHLHRRGDQRGRHRARLGRLGRGDADGRRDRAGRADGL